MNKLSAAADIHTFLSEQQASMTKLLAELVAIESPSDVAVAQQPILQRLKSEFEALEYRVRIIPGQGLVMHSLPPSLTSHSL